jgi:hypothetical protein
MESLSYFIIGLITFFACIPWCLNSWESLRFLKQNPHRCFDRVDWVHGVSWTVVSHLVLLGGILLVLKGLGVIYA